MGRNIILFLVSITKKNYLLEMFFMALPYHLRIWLVSIRILIWMSQSQSQDGKQRQKIF